MPIGIASGKFHGAITATTPRGAVAHLVALAGHLEERACRGRARPRRARSTRGSRSPRRRRASASAHGLAHSRTSSAASSARRSRIQAAALTRISARSAAGRRAQRAKPRGRRSATASSTSALVALGAERRRRGRALPGRSRRAPRRRRSPSPIHTGTLQRQLAARARAMPGGELVAHAARGAARASGSLTKVGRSVTARRAARRASGLPACSCRKDSLHVFSSSRRTR